MNNNYFEFKKSVAGNKPNFGKRIKKKRNHEVTVRLDESIPLETEAWLPMQQLLMHLTEFAPVAMVAELNSAIASYADDQARLGYILGQDDLVKELSRKVA